MKNLYLFSAIFLIIALACTKKDPGPEFQEEVIIEDFGEEPQAREPLDIPATEISLFKIPTSYYKKYVMLGTTLENSIPIVSGAGVSDNALQQAKVQCMVITNTLPTPVLNMLRQQRIFIVIFGNNEYPNVIPGWDPNLDATRYAGGYGPNMPGASCGLHEGDILNNSSDRYPNENIVIHEFGHAVKNFGLEKLYPTFKKQVEDIWNRAKVKGLWKNTYAITNPEEYWAEGIQSYFNLNARAPEAGDGTHNHVSTRDVFKTYDPEFYELIHSIYGGATLPPSVK
ncbi:hypothetical protein [Pedobacter metabolipauper]|uniref:Zinc-dependent peptidase n=1 Tax=Pedobacter metabolipauper TaxID=425513 RepID=A0A4R6SPU4_9SPHI|nr:hypothetical protein [Pedobacter metabolipauper]TDQ06637.1 hypothetical protein ATK78_4296 [Pedobacter metabolipauper]